MKECRWPHHVQQAVRADIASGQSKWESLPGIEEQQQEVCPNNESKSGISMYLGSCDTAIWAATIVVVAFTLLYDYENRWQFSAPNQGYKPVPKFYFVVLIFLWSYANHDCNKLLLSPSMPSMPKCSRLTGRTTRTRMKPPQRFGSNALLEYSFGERESI